MLVDVLAIFGIGTMSITCFLTHYLPISSKIRDYITSSCLFAVFAWVSLYTYIKTGQKAFILGLATSTFISSIFGALAGREVLKITHTPKFKLLKPEKNLFKKHIILLETYSGLTNRLLGRMALICDIKAIKKIFDECVEDHPILKGCWSTENMIKADAVLKNLEGMSEKEFEFKLMRTFSRLTSELIGLFRAVTSPGNADEMVRRIIDEMRLGREHGPGDEHEVLLGLPAGVTGEEKAQTSAYMLFKHVLGPLLRECKRVTIQKLQREFEGRAKKEAAVARVKISGDGMLDLSGLYEHLSGMEIEDGMQETMLTFSTILNTCYPLIKEDIGAERTYTITSSAFSGLLDRYGGFLSRYGIMDAIPEGVAAYSKVKTFAFMLFKDILEPLLRRCKCGTIKTIRDRLRELIERKPMIIGVKIADDGTMDLSKVYESIGGLPAEESVGEVISISSAVMNVCFPIIQRDIGFDHIKRTTENAFRSMLSEKILKEFELLTTFSEIIKAMPEGVLEKEKLTLLSKEELERKVRERTAKLEEAYKELKVLDSMKDEFLSMNAHELKTPLTVMKSNIELLSQGVLGELNEKQREALADVEEAIARQEKSVEKFLVSSKIDAGQMFLKRARVDPARLLEGVVESGRELAEAKGVELEAEAKEVPEVEVDWDGINMVLRNLIENAIQYTPRGGEVRVGVEQTDDGVLFWVRDNGVGISREDLDRIFERFYQVDHTQAGSGLGLSICKSLVEAHGGRIWAESEFGKGSTFYFTLPKGK